MQRQHARENDTGAGISMAGSSPRLYQRVIDIVDAEIRQGILGAHALLTETALAMRFGISRTPARRALIELEQAGLIARSGAGGFLVVACRRGRRGAVRPHTAGPQLVSQPSWQRIYGAVEGEIIARIAFASWRVNEAELARHFAVSRTVARDVLGRLQQRGLVLKDARSRWCAPALDADHVGELYELRWVLEPAALAKAATRLPEGLLARLHRNIMAAMARTSGIGGETLDRLEHDLHVTLLRHCGNRALMQAMTYPQSILIAHRFLYKWTLRLFGPEPFLPEHLAVVERLQAGRIADAAKALETHLRVSGERATTRVRAIAAARPQPKPLAYLERLGPADVPAGSPAGLRAR